MMQKTELEAFLYLNRSMRVNDVRFHHHRRRHLFVEHRRFIQEQNHHCKNNVP